MKERTLCHFKHPDITQLEKYPYPFDDGDLCLYLGDVRGMKGHGIFVHEKTNKVYFGYHIENFTEWKDHTVSVNMSINQLDYEEGK